MVTKTTIKQLEAMLVEVLTAHGAVWQPCKYGLHPQAPMSGAMTAPNIARSLDAFYGIPRVKGGCPKVRKAALRLIKAGIIQVIRPAKCHSWIFPHEYRLARHAETKWKAYQAKARK